MPLVSVNPLFINSCSIPLSLSVTKTWCNLSGNICNCSNDVIPGLDSGLLSHDLESSLEVVTKGKRKLILSEYIVGWIC